MDLSEYLKNKARRNPARLILPEGGDPRVRAAAEESAKLGVCRPVLMLSPGDSDGFSAPGVEILDSSASGLKRSGADAALVPWIGEKKAQGSSVAGRANVLVFPDLNSGNIAYKLVERLAGAKAVSPVVLGLNPPVNDLSRGCSVDDIIDMCAVTSIQAGLPGWLSGGLFER